MLMDAANTTSVKESVFLLYVDLDRLIEQCDLSPMQQQTIDSLMAGHTVVDMAEMHGGTRQAYQIYLTRAAEKIARQNTRNWESVYAKKTSD